jgi:hypothetical protein
MIPVGGILQAAGSIYGGIASYIISGEQSSLLKEQGALTRDDYFKQAGLVRDEGRRVRAKQTMEYISSGVEIVGTPQLVLKETQRNASRMAGSLETTGINMESLYRKKAKIARQEGVSSMISGIFQGAGSIAGGMGK